MDLIRICSCGACKVNCYKHGKVAKCDRCGKKRRLGTEIKNNTIRYICSQCCDELTKEREEAEQKRIDEAFNDMKKARDESHERIAPKKEKQHGKLDIKNLKVKLAKGKQKKSKKDI